MSKSSLQQNLEKLIAQNNYQIAELERRAGLRKNNVYNIIRGITRKPSAEILQAIADVFGITVKDLFQSSDKREATLSTNEEFKLLEQICIQVIKHFQARKEQIKCEEITVIINEAFSYSIENELQEPDIKFINWSVKQRKYI